MNNTTRIEKLLRKIGIITSSDLSLSDFTIICLNWLMNPM